MCFGCLLMCFFLLCECFISLSSDSLGNLTQGLCECISDANLGFSVEWGVVERTHHTALSLCSYPRLLTQASLPLSVCERTMLTVHSQVFMIIEKT